MRKLYWKIFISFWLATILIIVTTAWITHEIAQKSTIPVHEQLFMDSYANAAISIFESGHQSTLSDWLDQIGLNRNMHLYLITKKGEIFGSGAPPKEVKNAAHNLQLGQQNEGMKKSGNILISHEIISPQGTSYRLAAVTAKPLTNLIQIPWPALLMRLFIAVFISGLICYLLSIYLTKPLRQLQIAASLIAKGQLHTRVGQLSGHHKDEIAELSDEFDIMAEKIESLMLSKERLLQDISHELRSPLARLQIAIELGNKKTKSMAEPEFKRMEIECQRLNNLIGEILEFARLDKSPNVISKTLVDLNALLYRIIDDANYEYSGPKLPILMAEIQPCQLLLDERLIHRAIENIVRNALNYSPPEGQVSISLRCSQEHNQVFIEIEDSGPGVPEEQLGKIFNPFYRVDTSRGKRTGGFGLGLAIAQQAVKLHSGEILAQNKENGGFVVRVILPISL